MAFETVSTKKRSAAGQGDHNTQKRQKTAESVACTEESEWCFVCYSWVKQLRYPPKTCKAPHSDTQRACRECWEAYNSLQVEEKRAEDIECMLCSDKLPAAMLKSYSRPQTYIRYLAKLRARDGQRCQARCRGSLIEANGVPERDPTLSLGNIHPFKYEIQYHHVDLPGDKGRVFECKHCAFRTCTTCDRPEHDKETCEQYQARISSTQPQSVDPGSLGGKPIIKCLDCKSYFTVDKGCGYAACTACGYRMCSRCSISWVGEGSAYLGGKEAHGEQCKYRHREDASSHALPHRFGLSDVEGPEAVE